MKRRITKLPIVQLALVAVSLLVGYTLAPVAAQSAASLEGQVTVRSDGAVYLITGGLRRWVATVVISDDDLNAYPEAEPIYTGLAPYGGGGSTASSGATTAARPAASPAASTVASSGSSGSSGSSSATSTPDTDPTPGPTSTPDPGAMAQPSGGQCPADHAVKGTTVNGVKTYYEPDRPQYPTVTPEVCFTAGSYARNAGYVNSKK